MKFKTCTKCGETKKLIEFAKDNRSTDGVRSVCKKCSNILNKKYCIENKQKLKDYCLNNKEKIKEYKNKYYLENKVEISERRKSYNLKNKEKINKNNVDRRKIDINYRMLCNLRSRLYDALKGTNKSKRTIRLLGCSIEQLKEHLESQFTDEMNWDNYGTGWYGVKEWHVDHIKPCAGFDMSKPSEQEKCFHYTNLQPLLAIDNLKKADKF